MNKFSKYDLNEIIPKTTNIIIDSTAYNFYDLKEYAIKCSKSNCQLTLKNANALSKYNLLEILEINPNVAIEISNPDNIISSILNTLSEHSKTLKELKNILSNIKNSVKR